MDDNTYRLRFTQDVEPTGSRMGKALLVAALFEVEVFHNIESTTPI